MPFCWARLSAKRFIAGRRRKRSVAFVLSLGNQETLFLQPADDLRSSRRRANALGLLQALPQNLILNKAPGILHRLDQSAFVVTRRWPGLLVFDFRIVQLRSLAVAQRR